MKWGSARSALMMFAFGATVGSLLDAIHTHSGTTVYASEIAFKAAWWTPVLFGAAGLGIGLSYVIVERLSGRSITSDPTWSRIAIALGGFVGLYLASGYLPASNAVKLGVLFIGAIALGIVISKPKTPHAFGLACVAAITGPTVEVILVHNGAFRHLQADVWGIPIWLPALYASGSFTMGLVGKKLVSLPSSDARSLP